MPLKGIPARVTPELLFALARMGHGDSLVIADANFPSDSIATHASLVKAPIRVSGTTSQVLEDILKLMPLDSYATNAVCVMDRVDSDKAKDLQVDAYALLATASGLQPNELGFIERFRFYDMAKTAAVIIQTDDKALYANAIVYKGVL